MKSNVSPIALADVDYKPVKPPEDAVTLAFENVLGRFVTVEVEPDRLWIAPPYADAVFPKKVQFTIAASLLTLLSTAPPLTAELSTNTQFVIVGEELAFSTAPP